MPEKKQKILYIYAKSGGGHLAAAQAIADSIDVAKPQAFEHAFADVFADTPHFVQRLMNSGYVMLVYNLRWIWNIIYMVYSVPAIARFFIFFYKLFSKSQFQRMIAREAPDVIVLTFFVTEAVEQALAEIGWKGKLVTVVTDLYTPPAIWFLSKHAQYVVASNRVRDQAIRLGVAADHIGLFEGLTHQKFEHIPDDTEKKVVTKKYAIDISKPMILLTGGGLGLKQTLPVIKQLLVQKSQVQLIVICGRNIRLKQKVDNLLEKYHGLHNIQAFGYVDDMHGLIALASLVVTKAGPATMMEVFLQHKNMILTDYIWGQELGNYEFIVKNNFGLFQEKPRDIVESIIAVSQGKSLELQKPQVKNEIRELGQWLANYSS